MKLVYYFRQPDNKKEEYELYYNNTSLEKSSEVLFDTLNDYKLVVWSIKFLNNVK